MFDPTFRSLLRHGECDVDPAKPKNHDRHDDRFNGRIQNIDSTCR